MARILTFDLAILITVAQVSIDCWGFDMKRIMLLVGIAASVGGTANAEYGFSSKDWSKLSREIKQCHVLFSPWAHDLGNPAKLDLCLRLGGYDAMAEAEIAESKERAERIRKDAEREREAAERTQKLCERTLEGASRASCLKGNARMIDLAQKLEEERLRVAAEAEERARTVAAHHAAEAERLAARTPAQIEADRKAEERQFQEARAEQEQRARATAAAIPRMKEVAMDMVRSLLKDPDLSLIHI